MAQARRRIVELLADPEAAVAGDGPPLQGEPRPIQHTVKYYEKGERPLELVPTRQWFVRLLDKKEALIAQGEADPLAPRSHGEALPGLDGEPRIRLVREPSALLRPCRSPPGTRSTIRGAPVFDAAIVAEPGQMPVDPTVDTPPGYQESQRSQPGGFAGEPDIFDTWFTSSMTPQISSHWRVDPERHADALSGRRPAPGTRHHSHLGLLHHRQGPAPRRFGSLASRGDLRLDPRPRPQEDVEEQGKRGDPASADRELSPRTPCGTWAGNARLGVDTAFDEKVYKIGKRLVTKIFNASKFVLSQTAPLHPITSELDRAFIAELRRLVVQATESFEKFDHAHALMDTESFFWSTLHGQLHRAHQDAGPG